MVKKFICLHDKIVQKAINPSFQHEIPMDRERAHCVASAHAHDLHDNKNWTIAAYCKYPIIQTTPLDVDSPDMT